MSLDYSLHNLAENLDSSWTEQAKIAAFNLKQEYLQGKLPFLQKQIGEYQNYALKLQQDFETIVLLGTGGSSLGAAALAQTRGYFTPINSFDNLRPRFFIFDNLDGDAMQRAFAFFNLKKTHFFVISKSGNTLETLIQAEMMADFYKKQGYNDFSAHVTVITEKKPSLLSQFAQKHNLFTIAHPQDIGGRYSVFSVIGLLPAIAIGVDIEQVWKGASSVLNNFLDENSAFHRNLIQSAAAIASHEIHQKANACIFMGYGDRYKRLLSWIRQLWAESLGKEGKGLLPVTAVGPIDQHSQLQLYLGGKNDKIYHLITHGNKHQQNNYAFPASEIFPFLEGKSVNAVVEAAWQGTLQTLLHNQRLTHQICVSDNPQDYASDTGSIMMFFFLQVLLIAQLIEVNPFDQPAVEQAKQRTFEYLKR